MNCFLSEWFASWQCYFHLRWDLVNMLSCAICVVRPVNRAAWTSCRVTSWSGKKASQSPRSLASTSEKRNLPWPWEWLRLRRREKVNCFIYDKIVIFLYIYIHLWVCCTSDRIDSTSLWLISVVSEIAYICNFSCFLKPVFRGLIYFFLHHFYEQMCLFCLLLCEAAWTSKASCLYMNDLC